MKLKTIKKTRLKFVTVVYWLHDYQNAVWNSAEAENNAIFFSSLIDDSFVLISRVLMAGKAISTCIISNNPKE